MGFKLGSNRGVGHILITAGLIELVRRKSCSRFGRIGLNRISFINQILVIELFEQPPYRLHIFRSIGDISLVHIDPIPHFFRQIAPHVGVAHDGFSACSIVLIYANGCSDIFFGNPEFFFHPEFNGQPVGIPASFSFDLKPFLGFIATENVFDGPSHHVMNTWQTISRGRSFKENIGGPSFTCTHTRLKGHRIFPIGLDILGNRNEIQIFIRRKSHML